MQMTIEVPESLPRERLRKRLKELETSLQEEAKFLATVQGLINNLSEEESFAEQHEWLGCMRGTGRISGDILAPTSELVSWELLEK